MRYVLVSLLVCGCLVPASSDPLTCGQCDESLCPQLAYCEGEPVKDHCDCCTVCSKSKFQPHVVIAQPSGDNACDQVKCPKFKVCVENMQGVPLCTCPSEFVCRRHKSKKKEVCGTDGKTYISRCHMGIASCNQGLAVRKKYRGSCSADDAKKGAARYLKRMRKLKRRLRRKLKADKTRDELRGKKKRRHKRRKRRKIGRNPGSRNPGSRSPASRISGGKRRTRRHRGQLDSFGGGNYRSKPVSYASRSFEKTFPHYTWDR